MENLNKLRWRCRRGTLELDIMCQRYLDQCYQQASQQEQRTFLDLLSLEDNELIHYLMGDEIPKDRNLALLIEKMRQ